MKRSLLVEGGGGSLAVVIAGANIPDFKLLEATLDAMVLERPQPSESAPQNLCLDKGYDKRASRELAEERDYIPHIRRIGEEKLDEAGEKRYPARRWVVDARWAGFRSARRFWCVTRKKPPTILGLIKVACILLW